MNEDVRTIGTCLTCQNLFCPKPKMITLDPMEGCADWLTPEIAAFMRTIKTETVKEVME